MYYVSSLAGAGNVGTSYCSREYISAGSGGHAAGAPGWTLHSIMAWQPGVCTVSTGPLPLARRTPHCTSTSLGLWTLAQMGTEGHRCAQPHQGSIHGPWLQLPVSRDSSLGAARLEGFW
jgi:hypothetical protein